MKKSRVYEITAAILALSGAVILVAVYFPLINPAQFKLQTGRETMPLSYYLVATPIAVFILAVSWHFNCKARRMKGENK